MVAEIRTHDLETAFGFTRQSGYDRERGIEALHGYTQLKTVNTLLSGLRASTCWRWHMGSSQIFGQNGGRYVLVGNGPQEPTDR